MKLFFVIVYFVLHVSSVPKNDNIQQNDHIHLCRNVSSLLCYFGSSFLLLHFLSSNWVKLNMFKLCLSSSNYLTLPSKNTELFSSQMLSYQHRASPNETRQSVPCRLLLKSVLVFSKNPQKIPKISK